jgi:hypothetical protein
VTRSARHSLGLGVLILALAAPAQALAQAPSLTGEDFLARDFEGFPLPDIGAVDITGEQCNADGSGRFDFTASGAAVGPYGGTFQESGTFRFGPRAPGGESPLLEFSATFTVTSPAGEVTGTKTAGAPATVTGCTEDAPPQRFYAATVTAGYEATIVLPTGARCTDRGTALTSATLNDFGSGASSENFGETFTSLQATALCPPATPGECTRERAVAAGFKNRGDCVAFLATEGKNEPGKNQPK